VLFKRKRRDMSESDEKIKELFSKTLLSNEEIYWIGSPRYNFWRLTWRQIFTLFIPAFLFVLVPVLWLTGLWLWFYTLLSKNFLLMLILLLILLLASILRQMQIEAEANKLTEIPIARGAWWKPSYYAITNLRVLIFEQGNIRDYWYTLLDSPILKKPKNHAASIELYSSSYVAKKKKTPVLDTLRGIPEDEADEAFAILKQAREEALEERKDKMGVS
jgi:hypothetical protein